VREGAGEDAFVRYCQTTQLLSLGLADGVFSTNDTLDAGTHTWPILEGVFKMSSAHYWVHGRLYNHDACDMSVRAEGGTEECRLRAMMLLLSGSSIMFSDDLTRLPEERIVLMQQCMPPLPVAARPVNLFKSAIPDIWHLRVKSCGVEWDLVALFNFSAEGRNATIRWSDIGVSDGAYRICREFWTEQYLGKRKGALTVHLPGLSGRLVSLWKPKSRPQFVGTNLHLTQGGVELADLKWDEKKRTLSGRLHRAPGIRGRVYLNVPDGWSISRASGPSSQLNGGLWAVEVAFEKGDLDWSVRFSRKKSSAR